MLDDDDDEFGNEDLDIDENITADEYLTMITGQITSNSVETFELLCKTFDRNESLGIIIEALSKSLGNMISLVTEDNQQEVIYTANELIQQGLVDQQEIIAEMAYGHIGHS
jgi:Ca2+-binding EF-hand superfamily protein